MDKAKKDTLQANFKGIDDETDINLWQFLGVLALIALPGIGILLASILLRGSGITHEN